MSAPPRRLIHALLEGPSLLTGFEWHEQIDSTNQRVADLARQGHPEGYAVAADLQTAGRGRQGRSWVAPPGTSLMVSFLLRPPVAAGARPLLPLLVGLALAETVAAHVPGVEVALKWPNDLLVAGGKAAGVLVEAVDGAAVAGIGLNVDWRHVDRPDELWAATSLAAAAGAHVDRWGVFAGLVGVLGNRYRRWCAAPAAFLDAYRASCATLGQRVRVHRPGGTVVEGSATGVAASGALEVTTAAGAVVAVTAADVQHLRLAGR